MKNCLSYFHLLSFHNKRFTTLISEHKTWIFPWRNWDLIKTEQSSYQQCYSTHCNFESTTTESNNDGTPIYISKSLNYKLRKNLEVYKSKQLGSTYNGNLNIEKVVKNTHLRSFQNSLVTTLQTSWILLFQKTEL